MIRSLLSYREREVPARWIVNGVDIFPDVPDHGYLPVPLGLFAVCGPRLLEQARQDGCALLGLGDYPVEYSTDVELRVDGEHVHIRSGFNRQPVLVPYAMLHAEWSDFAERIKAVLDERHGTWWRQHFRYCLE